MNVRLYGKILSRIAFLLGVFALLSCFFARYANKPALLFYGMLASVVGTLISVAVIFVRTRYGATTTWKHISVISIILCSVPVFYVIFLLFISKQS